MPFGFTLIRVGKTGDQLEGWDMGKHAKDILFTLLNGVGEENL